MRNSMKPILILLSILACSAFISCEKETQEYPDTSGYKIKRVLYYTSLDAATPLTVYDYEYDLNKRLIRITVDTLRIDSFDYSGNNELTRKRVYERNYKGEFIIMDSTRYFYNNGLLVKEISYDPFYTIVRALRIYKYENSKLIEKYESWYQYFFSLTKYECSGNLCKKETGFADSTGLTISTHKYHFYKNNRLSKTELFGFNGSKMQIITYTYDLEGKLIVEEAKQPNPDVVNPYFYVIRYEYY